VAGFATAWTPLANPSVDGLAFTIQGTTTVLSASAYSVIVPTGGSCVTLTQACPTTDPGCASACDPAVPGKCAAYAGAVTNQCTSTATVATVSCCYPSGAPTCFTQPEPGGCGSPCQAFPGSTAVSCIPDVGPPISSGGAGGLPQSTCCFPAGAPVCVASQTFGSPAPRCSSGNACATTPGTTVASCTDLEDGTQATCCLAPGKLPGTLPVPALGDGGAIVNLADAAGGTDASGIADASGPADAGGDAAPVVDGGVDGDALDGADDGG
jgi:hypothetical protein